MERMLICMMCVDGPICACEIGCWMGLTHDCWPGLVHRKDVHMFTPIYAIICCVCMVLSVLVKWKLNG